MSAPAPRLPAVFVSHGAPSLVLDGGPAFEFLRALPAIIPRPSAIVCASAHWETAQPCVTAAAAPETIHDFFGFPKPLYELRYPAPGDPALAQRVSDLLRAAGLDASLDRARGLDHGAWVPLMLMFPAADIPVVEISVQSSADPAQQAAVGRALRPLREEGVLLLGSGGATHDLRSVRWEAGDGAVVEYARAFDDWLARVIMAGDLDSLVAYRERGPQAGRNHPTPEHYLPLLVAAGAHDPHAPAGRALHRSFSFGVLSMAAFAWD